VFKLKGLERDLPFIKAEIKKLNEMILKLDSTLGQTNKAQELVRRGKLEVMLEESERMYTDMEEQIKQLKTKTKEPESIKRCPKGSRRNKKTLKCEKY